MLPVSPNLPEKDQALLLEFRETLQKKYTVEESREQEFADTSSLLKRFQILQGAEQLTICDIMKISLHNKKCRFCTLIADSIVENVSRHGLVHEKNVKNLVTITIVSLQKDFGHVIIRPETLGDKIVEAFEKYELDFDSHPQFSYCYYVAAKDKEKARKSITYKMMDAINQQKDFLIEIYGNTLIAKKSLYSFNMENMKELVTLAFSL